VNKSHIEHGDDRQDMLQPKLIITVVGRSRCRDDRGCQKREKSDGQTDVKANLI
jgi:hypothetical protein